MRLTLALKLNLAPFPVSEKHKHFQNRINRLRPKYHSLGEDQMSNAFLYLYVRFQNLTTSENGQDLVEYALLVSLIALALISGINSVALAVNKAFSNVSNSLA
jgi:pilus assembly protein Flp/PilA